MLPNVLIIRGLYYRILSRARSDLSDMVRRKWLLPDRRHIDDRASLNRSMARGWNRRLVGKHGVLDLRKPHTGLLVHLGRL